MPSITEQDSAIQKFMRRWTSNVLLSYDSTIITVETTTLCTAIVLAKLSQFKLLGNTSGNNPS